MMHTNQYNPGKCNHRIIRIAMPCIFIFQSILVLLIALGACASNPAVADKAQEGVSANRMVVYVVGHDWHTGIILPTADILTYLPELKNQFTDSPYLEFGWGDKNFYQAEDPGAGLAIKALLWPTEAVMHVVAVPKDVPGYYPQSEIHRICILPDHYTALLNFIFNSFRLTKAGGIISLKKGLYGNAFFYEAKGRYSLFNTCNTWTAKGLKQAGLNINPGAMAAASALMDFMRKRDSNASVRCNQAESQRP